MYVTPLGMLMLVSDEQPENAMSPMLVTPSGITILVSDEQPENAMSPMLVTPSGITILVSDEQPENALLPMLVTSLGITVFLQPLISVFVEVFIMALHPLRESYTLLPSATTIASSLLQPENAL